MARNLRNMYKASKLSYDPENDFQFKKHIEILESEITQLQTSVKDLTTKVAELGTSKKKTDK